MTNEQKHDVVKEPKGLCHTIDKINNLILAGKPHETRILLDDLKGEAIDLRTWGEQWKYKSLEYYKMKTNENKEVIVQMVSDNANEHCDKFPNLSFHKGTFIKENIFEIAGGGDFIPPTFKIKVVDSLPEVKDCKKCNNIFPNEPENFMEVEGEETCIRCFERIYIPARARDVYHDKMKVQFLKKLNKTT